MTETSGRRLAAIMFTDVVGYTELVARDEPRAVRARERHRALLRPLVEQFEGELLETPGDESLSIFSSALLAVDCALAVQAALRDDPDLHLRIGIHLGDVLRHDGELIGDGVNVAARIRPVRTRVQVTGRSLGAKQLKNVAQPVAVYALETPLARRRRWPVVAAAALLALVGTGYAYRVPLFTALALWAPKVFASPIPQKLAFATASDGVRIAYATTGSGPAIVYVLSWATHLEDGLGSPIYDAEDLLSMTSRRHLFVRYDGRGFGLSDRNVRDFSLDARVRDLEAVVDALGVERIGIYAASAGGPPAIAYTARHPQRVARLVLAGAMASYDYLGDDRKAAWERVLGLVETDWDSRPVNRLFTETMLQEPFGEVELGILAEFMRRSGDGPAVAAFNRAILGVDVREEAKQIDVPTLIVHARDDGTVFLEAALQLAALIPDARFEIVEGHHRDGAGNTPATRARILEFFDEATW
jgi:pimeloyl-ACP methyl ester carboxylesterase